jgi:predicted nucleotidyltransferase
VFALLQYERLRWPPCSERSVEALPAQAGGDLTLRITRRYIQIMRSAAPALLPIFRSRLQADLLSTLLLRPDQELSLTDLATRLGAPLSTVHGEVGRLVDAGLLVRREAGRSVVVRSDPGNRLTGPLTELLLLSWGPPQVVAEEFARLRGAEQVLIFGSWAARSQQRPGKPPNDLDVLVVGRPRREDVYDAADRAQQRLGLPVNPVIRTPEAWSEETDPLVQHIRSSPFVEVLMPDDTSKTAD